MLPNCRCSEQALTMVQCGLSLRHLFPINQPVGRFQMRNRIIGVIGVVAIVIVVAGLLRMTGMSVDSQTAGPSPKTPWGEPDLQGIWTDPYQTPLQRPAQFASKEFFTDEERAELDRQRAGIPRRDARV